MAGLFLIKDFMVEGGHTANPILSVYGYRSNVAVLDELNELASAFIGQMLPKIVGIQSTAVDHQRIEVYELNTPNFVSRAITSGQSGTRSGANDAIFMAWGFRLNRATLGTRSGSKRIGPVADSDVSGGLPVSGVITPLTDFANQYGAPLKVALIDTWFPVILHRPTGGGSTWTDSGTNGASFVNVTTQNTRKR